jgi:hypothetical protein
METFRKKLKERYESRKGVERNRQPMGLAGVLFCIFLTLKLTGDIDWSWWWVSSPLWIKIVVIDIVLKSVLQAVIETIIRDE